eukprot:gnl/Spiro4/10580_TR5664_c0_g1_i1.p3 gnl/Spiro4/10580_TR5664_c0_g1~~gnl/Spiro4/10580_TR5664_c0_g1_i1.p3  ORF type:complete len:126 (+),score=29.74 gnl/Spiro4/10580_TR5664_c0_g1_i1:240-617(+)
MKEALAYFFGGLAIFVLILILGLGTSWFGLVTSRPMAQYAKETERRVYLNSVAHQQGADSGIGIDCGNMRNVSLPIAQRHAFASLVVQDAAAYAGNAGLSAASIACVTEANDLLATAIPQTNGTN